jgi:hypothetical protein
MRIALPFLAIAYPISGLGVLLLSPLLGPSAAWLVGESLAVFLVAFCAFSLVRHAMRRSAARSARGPSA